MKREMIQSYVKKSQQYKELYNKKKPTNHQRRYKKIRLQNVCIPTEYRSV